MPGLVARYTSSIRCYWISIFALSGALVSGWFALRFPAVTPAAAVLLFLGIAMLGVARLPAIEVRESNLMVGRRAIPWNEIRAVDQSRWIAPLVVHLTLADGNRVLLMHAAGRDSSAALLRHLRRYARQALLDGIPYRQFWGEMLPANRAIEPPAESSGGLVTGPSSGAAPIRPAQKPRLLRLEDEEDVERMFQRLKSVGRLDGRDAGDARGTRGSDAV